MAVSSEKWRVDRRVLNGFRRRAWRAFPKEHIEALIGRNGEIHAIDPIAYLSTRSECVFSEEEFELIRKQVHPLQFLGTIHTHPGLNDASPSETDWLLLREVPERITGICAMYVVNGRRRSRVQFYRATAPFYLEVK